MELPEPIIRYLEESVVDHHAPAFLLCGRDGLLRRQGGALARYGLEGLRADLPLADQVLALAGQFPLDPSSPALVLPLMQMESEATADIHLFRGEEGDWVLLLDAAEAARQRQQLQQKGNELSLSYQRLVKEIQKKEILLHAIVHDLAGPLMGIRGGFELLASEQLSPQGRELLDLGLRQASRQEQLIRDILQAFSAEVEALEAFTLDPARAPDAALCAREVIAALRPAFEINQVQLALETPDGSDFRVVGEKSRLERVISNLVENALRHSPPRSQVTIGCRIDPPHVLVTIDDEGPGVPDALAAGLFQKFTQIPGKKAGKIGLGLYFCRLTVEHWGGTIGHETRSTGGSRFWFRLPQPGGAA